MKSKQIEVNVHPSGHILNLQRNYNFKSFGYWVRQYWEDYQSQREVHSSDPGGLFFSVCPRRGYKLYKISRD